MRKVMLAVLLSGGSVSAQAAVYVGQIQGTVTSRFATEFTTESAAADIAVGDTITADFTYVAGEGESGSLSEAMGWSLASAMTDQVSFELAGHRWTSRGAFLSGLVPLSFGPAHDPFQSLYLTTDDAPGAGDLHVQGYGFEIGEFGYDLYQGWGYAGSFDLASLMVWQDGELIISPTPASTVPLPEPATWALMIAGFGMAGAALRRRRPVISLA
jgi:hypothetical protein